MKKQTFEAGLEYIKTLGIKAAKDRNAIKKNFEEEFGKKETAIFFKEFDDLCNSGDSKIYDYKNSDYKKSLLFTGSFDGDIIRKCCNWISENVDSFGKNILEVGCDCGLMTCFLGLTFPDSTILSIDREENGIKVAEELAEKLGIKNIVFKKTDLSELEEGEFDTVFSMRTAIENGYGEENPENNFMQQTDSYKIALAEYGKLLSSKVKKGGTLITIENTGRDALMAGWIEALYDAGLTGDVNLYKEIICKEVENTVDYQALIFNKEQSNEKGRDFFLKLLDHIGCYSLGEFKGWAAKLIYETKKDEILDGFKVSLPGSEFASIFSIWSVKNEPDKFIFYQTHEGISIVQIHKSYDRAKIDKIMNKSLENAKKYSTLKVEKL